MQDIILFLSFIQQQMEPKSKVLLLSRPPPPTYSSPRKWELHHPGTQPNKWGINLNFFLSFSLRISTQQVLRFLFAKKSQPFRTISPCPPPSLLWTIIIFVIRLTQWLPEESSCFHTSPGALSPTTLHQQNTCSCKHTCQITPRLCFTTFSLHPSCRTWRD